MRLVSFLLAVASCHLLLGDLSAESDAKWDVVTNKAATAHEKSNAEVPNLFDAKQYAESFDKKYNSELEAQTRAIYLLANAMKVYNSGVAYKFRHSSHHLKLNSFSDRSPLELERMQNHLIGGEHVASPRELYLEKLREGRGGGGGGPAAAAREETWRRNLLDLGEKLEHELEETLAKHEISEGSLGKSRKKRHVEPVRRRRPRELSMSDLVQDVRQAAASLPIKARVARKPKTNNLNYDRLAMEVTSRGLKDQQERVEFWLLSELNAAGLGSGTSAVDEKKGGNRVAGGQQDKSGGGASRGPSGERRRQAPPLPGLETDEPDDDDDPMDLDPPASPPDEVFSDLRHTGCWFAPRFQGDCGCCYAFAAVSIMEYLYCMRHRQLVAFSEQYIVDCANGKVENLKGCWGGDPYALAGFLHNFGLELLEHYPYAGRELQCPYTDETDLKTVGFMRIPLGHMSLVPASRWPETLKWAPMFVAFASGPNFIQYGHGVDSGEDCAETANHAMVMIGHGREDGQDYWLLRNSYGPHWGEAGHYKLTKSAPKRCIESHGAFLMGTRDGLHYAVPDMNPINPSAGAFLKRLKEVRQRSTRTGAWRRMAS